MSTIPVQVRLAATIVERLDNLASEGKISRADVLRGLVEGALTGPPPVAEPDPLLDQIAASQGVVMAKLDAILSASRNANANAEHAYANARLHARLALPADRWKTFKAEMEKRG